MARPLRLAFENAVYHITTRGNRKDTIFSDDEDRRVFLDKLNETCVKYSFGCYAYCLMDNHYHLFVKTPLANISAGMHSLNASYTNWFKAKHKIVGVVFQGRYRSILVDEDTYAVNLSAYIHGNPHRAGIVKNLHEYRWSSFRDYLGDGNSGAWLDRAFILNQFDSDPARAREKYESYVMENLAMDSPMKFAYKGIALGSESFLEEVQEKMASRGSDREIPATKVSHTSTAEEIIRQVIDELSVTREDIFSKRKGNISRQMTLYLLKKYTALSLKEIGELFQMDYAAVSQACKRYEEKIRKESSSL